MTAEQQDFINRIAAIAAKDMPRSGVLASLTIAQAILESGWGKSGLTVKANALFGIKAAGSVNQYWKGRVYNGKTQECYDGKNMVTITDGFRAYDSWEDSIADHSALLTGAARYKNIIGEKDCKTACKNIQADGYSTAPNYADTLIKCIETYNLAEFDRKIPNPADLSIFQQTQPKYDTEGINMPYKNHVISTQNEKRTSPYGWRTINGKQQFHDGIDIVDANGLQLKNDGIAIFAIADGKVAEAGKGVSVGNYADIAHEGKILTRYFHMRDNSIAVKKGDTVKKGQKLGIMGTTGDSTGVHLHFAVRENSTAYNNGDYVDPEPYLTGAKTIGATSNTAQPAQINTALQVGHKVKVRQGAKDHSGGNLASHVYSNVYDVHQINGDRAVIGAGGKVTAAVNVKDLQKV